MRLFLFVVLFGFGLISSSFSFAGQFCKNQWYGLTLSLRSIPPERVHVCHDWYVNFNAEITYVSADLRFRKQRGVVRSLEGGEHLFHTPSCHQFAHLQFPKILFAGAIATIQNLNAIALVSIEDTPFQMECSGDFEIADGL
jgi:hypothetical protein